MMNIDNHIINYKRNFLANFSQINNGRCKYIYGIEKITVDVNI